MATPHRRRQTTDKSMANSSQRMALSANKNKNWRANYLRALNIFTPDLATSSRPRHVDSNSRGRSVVSSSRSKRTTSPPSDEKTPSYVFGLRSHLFRARRLTARSDTMIVDHVSAPIEIPTETSVTSVTDKRDRRELEVRRRGSNDFPNLLTEKPMVQLLSWEEPSVMLSNGWPLESDKRERHASGRSRPYLGITEECEETEDEDADGFTNTEDDDDDDIFKMEFEGDSNASGSVFRSKRASKGRVERRRVGRFNDFDDDQENDAVQPLSASFVPPHQMVERGCFSLGLRDELKRKPGVI